MLKRKENQQVRQLQNEERSDRCQREVRLPILDTGRFAPRSVVESQQEQRYHPYIRCLFAFAGNILTKTRTYELATQRCIFTRL